MSNPYEPPPEIPPQSFPPQKIAEGDNTHGVIPYKNPHALIAYYTGIFLFICCITPLPLGVIPLVLGIMGLQARAQNPVIKGSVHAWIGIIAGGISALCSLFVAVMMIIGALAK